LIEEETYEHPTLSNKRQIIIVKYRMSFYLLNSIERSDSTNPQSAIRNPQSAIRNPQSAIRNPQSAIRNPQSAIPNPKL